MGRVGGWMGQGVSTTQPHGGASRRGVPMWVPDAFLHLWLPPWAPGQGFGVCRPHLSPPHPQDALRAISPPLDDPCPGLAPASGPWVPGAAKPRLHFSRRSLSPGKGNARNAAPRALPAPAQPPTS